MRNNFECKNGIYLEPRLQEYIKKKIYYKQYNINPVIPLEKEFCITREDIRRLKDFKSGNLDIYNHKTQEKYLDKNVEPKFEFDPDETYKSDIRYQRFLKKKKRDSEAMKQRHNYGKFDEEYKNAFNPITNFSLDAGNANLLNENRHEYLLDGRDFRLNDKLNTYNSKYKCKNPSISKRVYKVPKINQSTNRFVNYEPNVNFSNSDTVQYKFGSFPKNHETTQIIGNMDSYRNNITDKYQRMSEMDTDFKIVIPNVNSNGKKSHMNLYHTVPYRDGGNIRNISTESLMRDSLPTRATKSFGYNNPVEHYFDYIDSDIQDPNHVVFEPGISTRLDNHSTAKKKYQREILN